MIKTSYEYAVPRTTGEAATLLARDGSQAIAGGQTLVTELKTGEAEPSMVVDLGRIESLRGIDPRGAVVRIGAMTTVAEMAASRDVPAALAAAARNVADPQVRNRATVGGNLRTSTRGSDIAPMLLVLGATANVIESEDADGARTLTVEEYVARPPRGVLTSIDVPLPGPEERYAIQRFSDRPGRPPLCAVAVRAESAADGGRASYRIAVAAGGPPQRLSLVEQSLERTEVVTADVVRQACAQFVSAEDFMTDVTASREYRAHLTRTLIFRAFGRIIAG